MLNCTAFLWKRWSNTKNITHKKAYNKYASKCKKSLLIYQIRVELKLVKENNISKFFNYVNRKLNNSKSIFPLKDKNNNNKITCSNEEIADVFNKHFGSVFANDNNYSTFINSYVDDSIGIKTVLFPPEAVYKSLKEIKASTSYGPDGIPNILLKKLAHLLCIPLSFIFGASFKSSSLPKQWR
ncbi:uncharacterized protein LOC136095549 [Hydra vulgaris]|uniref:uncharacterized protein LOC136095549 n=1 Tax=Hydra vulgaris TaxID=6087 RepID=UPI0032E9FA00